MIGRLLRRLRVDRAGTTVIEFAFVAPVMLLLLMGLCDLAYQSYLQSILTGALQKAGRDSTIQGAGANAGTLDAAVIGVIRSIAPNATYVSSRQSYAQFGNIGAEPFQDNKGTGIYDATVDCFTDLNGNGVWDADAGVTGQGGANDVVLYKMTVSYPRLFPLAGMLGWSSNQSINAQTILKNQPWALQAASSTKQCCPSTGCS